MGDDCEFGQDVVAAISLKSGYYAFYLYNMFGFINFLIKIFNTTIGLVKSFVDSIFSAIGSFFGLIKSCIDIIYKVVFIVFFCVIAYICYVIFSSATSISKKLDDIKDSISYIESVSDNLSKTLQIIKSDVKAYEADKKIEKVGREASRISKKIKKFI